jgi:hypothetical protein
VRLVGGNSGKARLRPQQWLLIEWPANQSEPTKYSLSTLPEDTSINELVGASRQCWRIERDYQDIKQDSSLGHCEGRGWRGFHHHASLCIAAYEFLMAERLIADKAVGSKKIRHMPSACPFRRLHPRVVLRAQRHVDNSITTLRHRLSYELIVRLGECPCYGHAVAKLLL